MSTQNCECLAPGTLHERVTIRGVPIDRIIHWTCQECGGLGEAPETVAHKVYCKLRKAKVEL